MGWMLAGQIFSVPGSFFLDTKAAGSSPAEYTFSNSVGDMTIGMTQRWDWKLQPFASKMRTISQRHQHEGSFPAICADKPVISVGTVSVRPRFKSQKMNGALIDSGT